MVQSAGAAIIAPLVSMAEPWQSFYAGHAAVSTSVIFVHLSALVLSAGLAVTNDRAIVRTGSDNEETRSRRLAEMAISHRSVIYGLVVSFVSGTLLFLADLEAFVIMPAFWVKMSLILLLFANASLMVRRERQLRLLIASAIPPNAQANSRVWTRLRGHAFASIVLWFAIVLAGTAMTSS